ncbi:MAG: MBL fold metallo-hydrolase [Thermodesulfobacteriota bacterium]|nr:MBL fold metallo-hydrolase [Thermodesulfobacteriota bacterium]
MLEVNKKMDMKITIIYDNTVYTHGLRGDWGFACMLEVADAPVILFDTGANGEILLSNMKKMEIDPSKIDEVIISHNHWDHTGGLDAFLAQRPDIPVYVPGGYPGASGISTWIPVTGPAKIHDSIFSTGELDNIEQSLVITTPKGLVIIAGCSHPGVDVILDEAARYGTPYALVGGFHGFSRLNMLKGLSWICPTHCTQHIDDIHDMYPEKYIQGGAGRVLTF